MEPLLFEAVMKGYHLDTSDYLIDTGETERVREGTPNI